MSLLHRRDLMLGVATLAGAPSTVTTASAAAAPEAPSTTTGVTPGSILPPGTFVDLWPGPPPGGPGPGGDEQDVNGSVRNVVRPRMFMQRPAKPNGSAVLVLGGGGYRGISIAAEGRRTADYLLDFGVTTFVLYYRLPNAGWPMAAPFQDAQRAMRLIRARAEGWGLDESQIGIMGYSAGGHCAGMTSMRPDAALYPAVDDVDERSARPDFSGLIYPVLTMMPPNRTRVTTLTLLGPDPTLEACAAMSVEKQVTDDAPTTFLAHATDDPIAPVENSLGMFAALRRVHVPVEMHVFRSGGHGFNIGLEGNEDHAWPRLFATWAGFTKS